MKMAVFWVVALIALMMEAARTSETLVNFYQTTRCYNPEDSHLHFTKGLAPVICNRKILVKIPCLDYNNFPYLFKYAFSTV
jgi:hypothetical protein